MATKIYSEEQLNYFRVCHIATDILPQALRSLFKQEWDNRYKATYGEWKDTPQNGLDFQNGESPAKQKRNARLLATIVNGNRAEWDCTMLFYAILYSDSIHGLSPLIRSNVDDLRKFRNEDFAHMAEGQLSNADFSITVAMVETAFRALGLPAAQIQTVSKQTSFPTDELQNVMTNVQKLTLDLTTKDAELQDKNNELQKKATELQEEKKKTGKKDAELQEEKNKLQEKHAELQEKEAELQENNDKLQNTEEQRKVLEEQLHRNVEPFCVLPPRPPHPIASRDSDVAKITQQLLNLKKANPNSLSYCYVSGNPGSGKSQLAGLVAENYYEEARKDTSAPSFVMTLCAETSEALLTSYLSLARKMGCPEYTITTTENSKDFKTEEKIAIIKDLISKKIGLYTSWLLVIDNVTNVAYTVQFLPERGNGNWGKGQLLITSQDCSSIPPDSSFTAHISISKGMETTDATCLLVELSGITDSDMAGKVANSLDYQPLALASAGMYMRKVGKTKPTFGWKKYLKKLEEGKRGLTEKELSKINPFYSLSMTVATRIAVQTIMDSDEILKCAFTFLAFCAPEPLKLDILTNYILNVNGKLDKEEIEIQIQGSSLLLFENEDGVNIRLHKVVHDSVKLLVKERVNIKDQVRGIHFAVTSHSHFIRKTMRDTWQSFDSVSESRHIVSHLITLTVEIRNTFIDKKRFVLFKSVNSNFSSYFHFQVLGRICHLHGEYFSAIEYFSAALKCIQLGETKKRARPKFATSCRLTQETMSIYHEMAILYHALGDHQQAKKYYELVLSIQLSEPFPDNVYVANTYHNMGTLHLALGDHQQAKGYYKRALSDQMSQHFPDYLGLANSYHSMGTLHLALGEHQQAKEWYERTLSIRINYLGPDHVVVASTYRNMGILEQYAFGDHQQAKKCYEKALLIQLNKLGSDHVDVASTYHSMGILHRVLGDYQQAQEYYERTLSLRLNKLGPAHVGVASIYHSMGILHHALNDYPQAKEYYERAITIRLNKLGPDHVDVASTYHNMGNLHYALGDYQLAKECYERALPIQLNKLGPDHVDVASSYHNMGSLQYTLGDHQQAKECYERALSIQLNKLGPDHVDVASTCHSMGILLRSLGDHQQAKEYYERTLCIRLNKLGANHTDVASIYHSMGILHHALDDYQQAKECYERALSIRLDKLGPNHVEVASTYHNMGNLHYALGDHQQAKEYYERALSIQLNKLGPAHVDVASTYHNMGILHYALGDHQQAKESYECALSIRLNKLGPDHVDVAGTCHSMGNLHHDLGDYQQAAKYYERASSIELKKLGLGHVVAASTYHDIGNLHRQLGDHQQTNERYELGPNFVGHNLPSCRKVLINSNRSIYFPARMVLACYDPVQFIQPKILQGGRPNQTVAEKEVDG